MDNENSKTSIKIVSWNCNMAFRKKVKVILDETIDVLIIQECECIDKLSVNKWDIKPNSFYWFGKNKNKGIAIFTFNGFKIDHSYVEHNEDFEYIIPVRIAKDTQEYLLYAVWTQKIYDGHYTRHIFNAVEYYRAAITSCPTLIIGDYNSNSIWDKKGRKTNHSNLVSILSEMNMSSVYHSTRNEKQGEEKTPTLYFQRKENKTYHIDFFFISNVLLQNVQHFTIGKYNDYISYSDHMPLCLILKNTYKQFHNQWITNY